MEFVKCRLQKNGEKTKLYEKNKELFLRAISACRMRKILKLRKVSCTPYVSPGKYEVTHSRGGIIFETQEKPRYWSAFNTYDFQENLRILKNEAGEEISKKIEKKLVSYFFCNKKEEFIEKFPSLKKAVLKFGNILKHYIKKQRELGLDFPVLSDNYNEILFDKDIKITINAVFYPKNFLTRLYFRTMVLRRNKHVKKYFMGKPIYKNALDYFENKKPWGVVK